MALAAQLYHNVYNCFPPGGITEGNCCSSKSRTNWAIALLPYLEQRALHDLYDHDAYNEDPSNERVRQALVSVYICPADVWAGGLQVPCTGPGGDPARGGLGLQYRTSSYKSVAGCIGGDKGLRDQGWWDRYIPSWPMPDAERRGVMRTVGVLNFRCEAMRDVRDGTSQTLLVGEKSSVSRPDISAFWAYSYLSYVMGHTVEHPLSINHDIDGCLLMAKEMGVWGGGACCNSWGSFHPGVIQFALADGSTRAINKSVDLTILCALSTINGGEAGQLP
jgi:hypothetical protein